MSSGSGREVEIKLRLSSADQGRRRLRRVGFRVARRRVFEHNVVFDTRGHSLRRQGCLLRLREAGRLILLTFKGASERGKYKIREEIELGLSNGGALCEILGRLGYAPSFRYEKYRTEFSEATGLGRVMLDETPIGDFLELEGPPKWIDRTARRLGFTEADYVTASYAELHMKAARGKRRDMLFGPVSGLRTR
jgi:adenylate cyclase class 2